MKKEISEKRCENCLYFVQHYAKHNTFFHSISSGHCVNDNSKKWKPDFCNFWEDNAVKEEKRKIVIRKTIENMAEQLDKICMVLEAEEAE